MYDVMSLIFCFMNFISLECYFILGIITAIILIIIGFGISSFIVDKFYK